MIKFERQQNGDVKVTITQLAVGIGEPCRGCNKPLTPENDWMMDGCPCNTAKGINGPETVASKVVECGIWVSNVLSMTSFSERCDWGAWMGHHCGKTDVLKGQRGGY